MSPEQLEQLGRALLDASASVRGQEFLGPYPEDRGDFGPEAWPTRAQAPTPRVRRKVVRLG